MAKRAGLCSTRRRVREYERPLHAYSTLGYETVLLPRADVAARADFLMEQLVA